jgi:hypothetical protein
MSTSPIIPDSANAQPPANTAPPVVPVPVTASAQDQSQTVSNAPPQDNLATATSAQAPSQQTAPQAQQPTQSQNPSVRRAGWIKNVADVLAGGPRVKTTIDPVTGATTRTPIPVSGKHLGMAIALEAISGGLTGLGQRGPDAAGRAAAAGVAQGMNLAKEQQQNQEQQAQRQYENESQSLVRKAQAFESNSRAILNTQQAERMGLESLKDAVSANSDLLQSYQDNGAVSQDHVLQDDLKAGLQSGKYDFHSMVAIPDGWTNVPGKGFEQTFSIIAQPSTKVLLTQSQVDQLSTAHVPGFPAGMKVPSGGYPVPGVILANALQRQQANRQMMSEASDVSRTLSQSSDPATKALAAQVPDIGRLLDDPQNGLALQSALPKLQKYMHHDGSGDNFYEALVKMGQPTRPNPTNPKQMISNTTDAQAAQVIAGAFGNGDPQAGWKVLKAYHDEITPAPIRSESEAEGILADQASTPRQKGAARQYLALVDQQKATQARSDAQARASVEASGNPGNGPNDVQTVADAIAQGRTTFEQATQGMGKEAAAFRRQVESSILNRYPSLNLAALKAFSHDADNVQVQSQLQMARSLFGAYGQPGSFDDVEDAIRAVPKAPLPILSALGQRTAYQLGSPQMARLKTIQTDLATDLAKFNTGAGARGSDHQLDLYREQLQSAQTPEQVEAAMREIRSVSAKRLGGIVGTNPYLKYMVRDVNDPVTKLPLGAPSGAKGTVKGSDGKLHWTTNGRDDLGAVQ